jgi:hypothetical protein
MINTPEEIMKIMQAYIDGKKIQYSSISATMNQCWKDTPTVPSFNFGMYTYRIKPIPQTDKAKYEDLLKICEDFIEKIGYSEWHIKTIGGVTTEIQDSKPDSYPEIYHLGVLNFHTFVDKIQQLKEQDG